MSETRANTFQVTHPDFGTVQVSATDKYAAIIAAAKQWGERWTEIAKDCVTKDLGPAKKHLCKRCGRVWISSPGYCPQCQALVNARNREIGHLAKAAAARRRHQGW